LCVGCTIKSVPPSARLIDRIDVIADDKPRVPPGDVEKRLASRATTHFPPFAVLSGVPVLGALDAVTVEYNTLDRFVLQRDLDRVRRYYRARGFYEAQVQAGRVVPTGDERHVRVEIAVREGEPVLLGEVQGPKELLAAALERKSEESEVLLAAGGPVQKLVSAFEAGPVEDPALCDQPGEICKPRPRFDEDRYEELKRAIARTLGDAGFAYARVEGHADIDLLTHRARIRLSVDPGPLCTFGEVTVAGNGGIPEGAIRDRLGFAKGARYSAEKLEAAHDELADLGVFGSIDVAAQLDQEKKTPDVPVAVNVQPIKLRAVKFGFGGVFGSQLEVHASVGWEDRNLLGGLRRFNVEARPGMVFYPTSFSNLRAPRKVTPVFGVPTGSLLTNFVQPSFPGKRTDMRIDLRGSVYAPTIAQTPPNVKDQFPILGYYDVSGSYGFEHRFRFQRIDRSSVYLGGFLKAQLSFPFLYNRSDAQPTADDVDPIAGYKRVIIPYTDVIAIWDFRKDRSGKPTRTEPYRGVYTAFDSQFAFGDAIDARIQPEVRFYVPLSERVVAALRWTTGFLFPFNYGGSYRGDLEDRGSPFVQCKVDKPSEQCARDFQLGSSRAFYSGGPNSNRGYSFHDVGPHGSLGFSTPQALLGGQETPEEREQRLNQPTGGFAMWELSGELRFLVLDNFAIVTFIDASDVVRTAANLRVNVPHISPGVGLRLMTPVGPIRFDVGFRPPYLQFLGHKELPPGEAPVQKSPFGPNVPGAISLAIGEAF
jgi:hypothetical protein